MNDKELRGKLVFLTVHMDRWLREVTPEFNVPMANRLAKVVKVFDWTTQEGKLLLDQRKKIGKWDNLNPKDFKFILKVYYPELIKDGKQGVVALEHCPRCVPGTEYDLFAPIPFWMLKDFDKSEEDLFKVESKSALNRTHSKKVTRKKVVRKK